MKLASFTCPSQSTAFKNIAPLAGIAIKLINGLFLQSFHSLDMMDMPVSRHVSLTTLNDVSTEALSLEQSPVIIECENRSDIALTVFIESE